MTTLSPATATAPATKTEGVRDMQTRLYRDIGISAVAAALRFTKQPDPSLAPAVVREMPAGLRDHLAA